MPRITITNLTEPEYLAVVTEFIGTKSADQIEIAGSTLTDVRLVSCSPTDRFVILEADRIGEEG